MYSGRSSDLSLFGSLPICFPFSGVQTVTRGAENFLKVNSENGLTAAGTAPEWGRTRKLVAAFTSPDSLFIPSVETKILSRQR